jgi:GAF domain-containing protein
MTLDPIYQTPGPMTSAGRYADLLRTLPRELPALTKAIQGLQIHEYMLSGYGVSVPDSRKSESHLRRLDHMLAAVHARDSRPLDVARDPAERSIGVCRHFTVWFVGALRAHGIAARARVGFATYFNPPQVEDHWVGEYWDARERRWVLVDAQLDEMQRERMKLDFDPLDVPRDRFVVAHDAWTGCRNGKLDPSKYGFSAINLTGLWFIAGDLVRDATALNGMELLPWDVWGRMPNPSAPLTSEELAFFDRLAQLTASPDDHARELRELHESAALKPGPTVWNDRRQAREAIDAPPADVPLE